MLKHLLPAAQRLVNASLHYDIGAQQRLLMLAGKRLQLSISEPSLELWVLITNTGKLELATASSEAADARIAGKARDLFAILQAQDQTAAMMAHAISVEGDSKTFLALQTIINNLDIDWEMALGDRMGDLPAHLLADGIKVAAGMVNNNLKSLQRSGRNFLREEVNLLVPASLWPPHTQAITALKQQTERLAAKLARLQQAHDASNEG